jgi:hypothetical protein
MNEDSTGITQPEIDDVCSMLSAGMTGLGKRKHEIAFSNTLDDDDDDPMLLMSLAKRLSLIRERRRLFKKPRQLELC